MSTKRQRTILEVAILAMILLAVVLTISGCQRERIGIDSRDDCYLYDGADLILYSDGHSTETARLDGDDGDLTVVDITASGDAIITGTMTVSGSLTVSTLVTETTDLSLTGDLTVADVATIAGMTAEYITGTVSGTIPDWTVSDDLTVTDDTAAGGLLTIGEYVIYSEQTVVVCTEGAPITATGTYQPITSTAAITTSTTCAVYSGTVAGQVVYLVNENASHEIIVDDGANTDLGGNVTLGAGDILKLLWDGVNWLGLGTADN